MPQPQKFKQVVSVIERRIRRGDYLLRPLPSERKIAEETGVSHMTARKAVLALLDRNVLIRRENGALDISPSFHTPTSATQVVLLCPAFPSPFLTHLCQAVTDAAEEYGVGIRPAQYVHWDDPIVVNAVTHRGGVIVIPSSLDVPAHVLTALRSNRVVSLDLDMSPLGIPSIRLYSDSHFIQVFEHLQSLGHTRIDCITAHVHNPEIDRRIRLWRQWSHQHGMTGEIRERAAPSFTDPTPYAQDEMRQLIKAGPLGATAFVATTFPAALGASRACWEQGLVVGRDVSICAMNIESPARYLTPSITGLDIPDISATLGDCFDWFAGEGPWEGPLCVESSKARFYAGESTGPSRVA